MRRISREEFGHARPHGQDETEITRPHEALHEDTQAHEPVVPPAAPPPPPPAAGGPPPPPDGRVPPRLVADVLPWLAALGILALAALLVWLFVLNRDSSKGKVVPAVVGLQQQEAIAKLTGDGFNVRAVVGPSPKPAGIVASQKPGGGSRRDKGQTVVINVSNGHAVAAAPPAPSRQRPKRRPPNPPPRRRRPRRPRPRPPPRPQPQPRRSPTSPARTPPPAPARSKRPASSPRRSRLGDRHARLDRPGGSGRPRAGTGRQRRAARVAVGSARPAQQVPNVVGQKAGAARAALLDAKLLVRTSTGEAPKSTASCSRRAPPRVRADPRTRRPRSSSAARSSRLRRAPPRQHQPPQLDERRPPAQLLRCDRGGARPRMPATMNASSVPPFAHSHPVSTPPTGPVPLNA